MKKSLIITISTLLAVFSIFWTSLAYNVSGEDEVLKKAHAFAYENLITTVQSLSWFRPELPINRAQAAKMMVMFGRTYLGDNYFYRPDVTIDCSFSDRSEMSRDLRSFVIEACRFAIFAWGTQKFEPLGKLTISQAKTVIKRITGRDSVSQWTNTDNEFISRGEFVKLMYLEYEKLLGAEIK